MTVTDTRQFRDNDCIYVASTEEGKFRLVNVMINITLCIVDINECASNPCHELYGQCVDLENKYKCQCSSCNCTSGVEQYVDCIFGKFCELAL